ncbi:MAG: hypothetical protein V3U84_00705 [Thiotrichaceae bacterium]
MKKYRYLLCILLLATTLLLGCDTRRNETEIAEAMVIVSQVPLPDRYAEYDGSLLIPQGIEIEVSPFSKYDGTQRYRFTCTYEHTKWYLRGYTNAEAEVVLMIEGYSYFVTKTPTVVYEDIDYTKTGYSLEFLKQEADKLSWQ